MLAQLTDPRLRAQLFTNLMLGMHFGRGTDRASRREEFFFSCFTDTRLLINQRLIAEFCTFVEAGAQCEAQLHEFFLAHPVFLDPLAIEVRSKHALGDDFQTDFVAKRINNEYVLVEIEKTTDPIFTKKGVFHSELTEAVSQVRDFQAWIHDNIAYAQSKLPGIRRPAGLLVIGRRIGLSQDMLRRLDEENFSRRGHIRIVTYDDLIDQAKAIYDNMVRGPATFAGKRQVE